MNKYIIFLPFVLLLLMSCAEAIEEEKNEERVIESYNTVSRQNEGMASIEKNKEDKTHNHSAESDSNLILKRDRDTVHFFKNKELIKKTYVQPQTTIRKDSSSSLNISDEAFLLANNLIIIRDIMTSGNFCHIPEVHQVEIYPSQKDTAIIIPDSLPSESLLGFDLVNNFLGNKFNSPSGSWGVIAIEAEGEIYGLMVLYDNGHYLEINLSNDYYLHGEIGNAEFNSSNELIWSTIYDDGTPVRMILNKKGVVRVEKI